ncbi:unnamed protein product [Cochlearia groenlandica]
MEEDSDDREGKDCLSSPPIESITPFFLNPSDSQLLFSSPSLSPPILSTVPHLTHARFLAVSGVPPSVSAAISASFRIPHPNHDAARVLSYNRLQFLPCPDKNSGLLFFPTGTNLDQIGFLILAAVDSGGFRVVGSEEGDVFVATERLYSRILKIIVQPIRDLEAYDCNELGYVMVYSLYSIHWYCVKHDEARERPVLCYLGAKQFKRCSISSASWSPYVTGECLVLLENGEVFVFDMNLGHCRFRGSKLKVSWEGQGKTVKKRRWLGCDFGGGRVGVYIVARSDAVFVITRSSGSCSVRSLLEAESLDMAGTEEFVAFAKVGSDCYRFLLASRSFLFLCDQRSGVALLRWEHCVEKPCFVDAYSLSDLGVKGDDSTTSCVIIGSFWNAQSQMFTCGLSPCADKDASSCLYVQEEIPHNVLLPTEKCLCGDCELREMLAKESLPVWIDWQKKKVLVLGFGVLNKYLSSSDQSSGFTLIRLTSSGKLEAVKYNVSCDPLNNLHVIDHVDSSCKSADVNLLYFPDDEEYKHPKQFRYLELKYLSAHMKGTLPGLLELRMTEESVGSYKSNFFSSICHEELYEKMETCGFGKDRCSSTITAAFDSISSPTSLFEIAVRETWSRLPIELMSLAFTKYSELEDVMLNNKKIPSLEFLPVPEFPQLPPFLFRKPSNRSTKWSKKVQPGDGLIGPVLPLTVLMTLHEFCNGCPNSEQEFSPDVELTDRCNQIYKAAREMANSGVDEKDVVLEEDEKYNEMFLNSISQKEKKRFIAYSPMTKTDDSDKKHQELTTFVSKVRRCEDNDDDVIGGGGLEMFDDLSPVEISFEDRTVELDEKVVLTCKVFMCQWQNRSSSYQKFLSQHHLEK